MCSVRAHSKLLKFTGQVYLPESSLSLVPIKFTTSVTFMFTARVTFKFSVHQVYYQCHLQVLLPSSLLLRFTCKFYPPHLKLSLMADQVLADLCLQWEPIQNCSSLLLKFSPQVYYSGLLLKFTHKFYSPIWNCHWEQIKYWLIYVCSESPLKTVGRIRSSS